MQISSTSHTNFGSFRIVKPYQITNASKKILDEIYNCVENTTPPLTNGRNIAECLDDLAADISIKFTKNGKTILGLTRKLKEVGINGEVISTKNHVLRDNKGRQISASINPNAKPEDASYILNNFMSRCKDFFQEGKYKTGPNEFWRNYPTPKTPGHKIVPDTTNEKIINAYKHSTKKGNIPPRAQILRDLNDYIEVANEQCGIPKGGYKPLSDREWLEQTRYEKARATIDPTSKDSSDIAALVFTSYKD